MQAITADVQIFPRLWPDQFLHCWAFPFLLILSPKNSHYIGNSYWRNTSKNMTASWGRTPVRARLSPKSFGQSQICICGKQNSLNVIYFMFLRKYIVKCSIDLEHNCVWNRVAGAEFMNPLHNSFNWIFQISHHTQIINIHCSGKLASELLGLSFSILKSSAHTDAAGHL